MNPSASAKERGILIALACMLFPAFAGCEPPRREVRSLPDLGYPTCDGSPLPEGEVVASVVLRSGPTMREQEVVERFEIRERGCATVVRVSQEWPLGTADLDVVFDRDLSPLRIWKRTTMPNANGQVGHVDVSVFELRTDPVGLVHRGPARDLERFELRGPRPRAVIGPGRGLLTMLFRRAHLEEGGRVREHVIDVREPIAVIREVTLQRLADRDVEGLGRVRVYTIYGREPVFTDENDVVVGDLFGLRDARTVEGAIPDPMPDPGPIEPTSPP